MDKHEPPTDGKPGNGGNQHRHKGDLSLSPFTQLTDYSDENRPHNQFWVIGGVPLNPSLRPDFDMTDINDRDSEELNDWFNRPYIVTKGWNDIEAALNADRELSRSAFAPNAHNDFDARLDQAMVTARQDWFDKYPYGIRYEVRCLDGRVPDRATVWGTEGTLKAAIRRAKQGPAWLHIDTDEEQPDTIHTTREPEMKEKDDKKTLEFWLGEKPATEADVHAVYWLKRIYNSEEISEVEYKAFKTWYSASETHRKVFCELLEVWGSPFPEQVLNKKLTILNNNTHERESLLSSLEEEWDDEPATDLEIQAAHWYKIMSDVEVSEEDEKEFRRWLTENDAHKAAYKEHTKLWDNPYFELVLKEQEDIRKNGFLKKIKWRENARLDYNNPTTEVVFQALIWFDIICGAEEAPEEYWREFKGWYDASTTNQVIYNEVVELWDNPHFAAMVRRLKDINERAIRKERYQKVAGAVKKLYDGAIKGIVRFVSSWKTMGYTAAAASALFAAFIWVTDVSDTGRTPRTLYQTAVGEQKQIKLSDGSTVNINTNTQIYANFSNGARKITLTHGEAYFDVVKDGRPFLVEGGTGLVRVLGTAFEVKVEGDKMAVSVERGRVAVSSLDSEARYVEVTPRRQVNVNRYRVGEVEYQPLNTTVADWRDGWLEFKDRPLGEVIAELDKYYAGNISLSDKNLSDIRVSAQYNIQDIPKAIKSLSMNMQLDYSTSDIGDVTFFILNSR